LKQLPSLLGGTHVDFEVTAPFVRPEAKLAELAENGIDAAVLSVIAPLLYHHVDADAGRTIAEAANQGLAAFAECDPVRFRWPESRARDRAGGLRDSTRRFPVRFVRGQLGGRQVADRVAV